MSMLELDVKLPELDGLVKTWDLKKAGAPAASCEKCCAAHHQVCTQAHIQQH